MATSIIAYDRDLPEIPDRRSWEGPTSFLVKDTSAPNNWRVDKSGRRPSTLLLVQKLRATVDAWRNDGYPGASEVTQRLFEYWFEEDHEVPGFPVPFRYYFCQREAIETLVYLVEIARIPDAKALIDTYAQVFESRMFNKAITYQTTPDGQRQVLRFIPEINAEALQDLPPKDLPRYAFKIATGSGKTWMMAMTMVWSHYHKRRVPGSNLSTNFLIVAPNVIVYQRLEKDFASNAIFNNLPLIPPEWRPWSQKVILRGESTEPDPSCNLFLTNIHQLYESRDKEWTPENAADALLGRKPVKDLASYQRSMLERIKDLRDLVVINDEAHHVHDEELKWSQSLLGIHATLPKGLALWLDFSATPKDQNGMYYPWTVCDYPLAQAVEDRIVKAPVIVTMEGDATRPRREPEKITKGNVVDKYGFWIMAAVKRWKEHYRAYKGLGKRPVLFIMMEKNALADVVGDHLLKAHGFKNGEVLTIHTDSAGEITQGFLEEARQIARDIDKPESKIKAIVSVMMLREGWDVRNVSVVLGLRPFEARAEILPEQVIGRGLRLMLDIGPDRTQTLEVLGTQKLLDVLRNQLEAEGVGVATGGKGVLPPVIIQPTRERLAYDIAIPITKPRLTHNVRNISSLDPSKLDVIFDQEELAAAYSVHLRMTFATIDAHLGRDEVMSGELPIAQELLSAITNKVIRLAKLANVFAELYPRVHRYVATRCFGKRVNLDREAVRSHLARPELQDAIAKYLARKIGELMVETRAIEFENADFKLSDTKPFQWRRNLPPLVAKRTVFNYVATYNDFERRFAEFLDKASDALRFASLGTTEQGESGTQFRVDYLKPSGAIGFYNPDWVVVQKTGRSEINWIIETKGRVWESTEAKDAAMKDWCERISEQTGRRWRFIRVNQGDFEAEKPKTLADLTKSDTKLV